MLKSLSNLKLSLFIFTILIPATSWAVDSVRVTNGESTKDKRTEHKNEVIQRALEITEPEYGPYEFHFTETQMNRHRALPATIQGKHNNVYIAPANDEWNEKTIPIKIPIRRGLLNYRLLLVHKDDLPKFAQIKSVDDLKELTAGLRNGWVTTDVFKELDLKMTMARNFDGLFLLLDNHRFNYLPRAIYEIFDELDARQHLLKNVVIEPTLIIYLPMPTYVYVSRSEPRLAKRLETGLRTMLESGELDNILNKYYADDIKRANFKGRKVIKIENPFYSGQDLLKDESLWHKL